MNNFKLSVVFDGVTMTTILNGAEFSLRVLFLAFLPLWGTGCTTAKLFEKTSPMTEIPLQVIGAWRSTDEVIMSYNAQLRSESGQLLWEEVRFAVFALPQIRGTHKIVGMRLEPEHIDVQLYPDSVPVLFPGIEPAAALKGNNVVVWGWSFESADMYVIVRSASGEDTWYECSLPVTKRGRGWWANPTLAVLLPVTATVDLLTLMMILQRR